MNPVDASGSLPPGPGPRTAPLGESARADVPGASHGRASGQRVAIVQGDGTAAESPNRGALIREETGIDREAPHPMLDHLARDLFDLRLFEAGNGDGYVLELEMSLRFRFAPGPQREPWTPAGKAEFMREFERTVERVWDGQTMTTAGGERVTLDVELETAEARYGRIPNAMRHLFGGDAPDWDVLVRDSPTTAGHRSSVTFGLFPGTPLLNGATLDRDDVQLEWRAADGERVRYYVSAHEFGHMIGLADEYPAYSEYSGDEASVMNNGTAVRERHLDFFRRWAEEALQRVDE